MTERKGTVSILYFTLIANSGFPACFCLSPTIVLGKELYTKKRASVIERYGASVFLDQENCLISFLRTMTMAFICKFFSPPH